MRVASSSPARERSTPLSLAECVFTDSVHLIDTHTHYNLSPLFERWPELWAKAQAHGVEQTVIASVDVTSSQRAVKIAQQAPGLWALVGLHPGEIPPEAAPTEVASHAILQTLRQLLAEDTVLGVGEIGLDYYWLKPEERVERIPQQQAWFRAQLGLAQQQGGWVSLHIRDRQEPTTPTVDNAYWDAYDIMKEYDWSHQPFILHCVSGSPEYVQKMLDLGAYVGFDGNVTYPTAHALRQLLALVPRERLLLETDAPYLPPQAYRGQTCEPWMIRETAEFVEGLTQE
jgi:TatD DNase family protein